ncbi:hypothetical protein [uncultured Duncaniella sp.]|uniref:hypothetical protein n=1 Tax=uncultured Duncaniella sp. TaxID=2768039 RepID=UPI00272CC4F2|nr:hypothetical protein [uncultured Duncaniella sp.]
MATKDEYYQKIIVALQSDLTSNKSEISELKSMVARQQKEIEALKTAQGTPQKSSRPQQLKIDMEALRSEVKRVCDKAILANYEHLPTVFADRKEFESFRKSTETKFISANNFTVYKKSQETRLKSIEEKLGRRLSLLTINRNTQNCGYNSKSYFNLDTIINFLKTTNTQWVIHILVSLSITMLAVYLLKSITI